MELKNVEKLEKSRVKLTIDVKGEEFRKAVDVSYRKNASRINVPGFRKGKAPRKMLEKLYGEEIFYEDAVNYAYPIAYEQAVKEAGIDAIGQAEVDVKEISPEGFTVEATVAVKPEMTLKAYQGLSATYDEKKATEAEVKEELNKLADRMARTETVDRAAKKNDTVVLDFEGFVDGKAFQGGKGENFELVLGSGHFIPGFEDQLIGKKAGADVEVKVTFPEEYHAEELKGKDAVFQCKIHEVKQTIKPAIDDEFAKDASEFDTLQELKDDLKGKIAQAHKDEAERAFEESVLDALIENLEGEIPEVMVQAQAEQLVEDFAYRMAMQGMDMSNYMKMTGTNAISLRQMFEPQAERQVKVGLALDEVVKAEKIEISDEEVEAEIKKMAENYHADEEKIRESLPADSIKHDLATQKALEIVKNGAKKVKPKKTASKSAAKDKAEGEEKAQDGEKLAAKKTAAKSTKTTKAKKDEE